MTPDQAKTLVACALIAVGLLFVLGGYLSGIRKLLAEIRDELRRR